MFKALEEVVSFAAMTQTQTVSRATPSITWKSADSLRVQDNGPAD